MHKLLRLTIVTIVAAVAGSILLPAGEDRAENLKGNDAKIRDYAARLVREGRDIFRFDTFGSEAFWGGGLRLHEAIAGAANRPPSGWGKAIVSGGDQAPVRVRRDDRIVRSSA